jgi:hypothetical protein
MTAKPDPADKIDYRLDSGPPEKKPVSVTLTVSFETLRRLIRRILKC